LLGLLAGGDAVEAPAAKHGPALGEEVVRDPGHVRPGIMLRPVECRRGLRSSRAQDDPGWPTVPREEWQAGVLHGSRVIRPYHHMCPQDPVNRVHYGPWKWVYENCEED